MYHLPLCNIILLCLLVACAPLKAIAQTNIWTNSPGGLWETPNNWSLRVVPTNTHTVFITNAGTKTVTIDNGTASVTNRMTVSNLTVSALGTNTNTLLLNNATNSGGFVPFRVLNAFALGTNGALTITNAWLDVQGSTNATFTNDGTLTIENEGLLTVTNLLNVTNPPPDAIIGHSGQGRLQLDSGNAQFASVRVGNQAGGQGFFTQTGGTNSVSASLFLGYGAGSSGTYNLTGGVFTSVATYVGNSGTGIVNQVGGIHATPLVNISALTGSRGTYNLSNASLTTAQTLVGSAPSAPAVMNVSSAIHFATNDFYVGSGGGSGTYNTTNSSLTALHNTYLGYVGTGVFNQSGGTNLTGLGLILGYSSGASGTYNLMSDGQLSASNTIVGVTGAGSMSQTGGIHQLSGTLYLGQNIGGSGNYTFNSGSLSAAEAHIGDSGVGVMTHTGGTNSVTNLLVLGNSSGSRGTYNFNDGQVTSASTQLGVVGRGFLNQNGGVYSIFGDLGVGLSAGGNGSYNLTSGQFNCVNAYVGMSGIGTVTQVGGTATISNSLVLSLNPGGSGTWILQGGTLSAGSILINASAGFTESGGTLNGNVTNFGSFTYSGGTFNGRMVLFGSLSINAQNFTLENGLANFSTVSVANGATLTLNGPGLDNEGSLRLLGGTLGGSGGLTNNANLSGSGTIAGSGGFINNALLSISGGNLTLANTGANANNGNIDLASGLQLRLTGGALANNGSLNLNAGVISGTAQLINQSSGVVSGRGTIASPFNNAGGMVLLDSGTLNISPAFSNTGTLQLTTTAANLAGGAITSRGTIQGLGNIGNTVTNSGTIEAIGGTLTFNGSLVNTVNGLMTALSSAKILVTSGMASQAGVINLSDGTFDNNGWPLNNTGEVSGYGTFRTGGLANNGSITFSGGFSTINGNVTNQATRRITVAYNPALFTGTVVNNGTFKVTSTKAQFAGTYIENGAFVSDPATNEFTDVIIGPSGYFVGGAGDLFSVSGNFQNGSRQNVLWDTHDAELQFRGGASHTFSLAGADAGTNSAGFTTNFAWKTFRLASGESLTLLDGNVVSGAALYTRSLILEGGLPQISSITGNGFKIYYDPAASGNGYLAGGTYSLSGGGAIVPVTATSLLINSITRLSNGNVLLACSGVPNQAHSILSSTNLTSWLTIGSATAAASGSFSFTDTNAPNFSLRFYRLHLP